MAELKTLVCPKCGAQVQLVLGGERGTCTYCGTLVYVDNPRRQATDKPGATPRSPRALLLVTVGIALSLGMAGALAAFLVMEPAPTLPPPQPAKTKDVFKTVPAPTAEPVKARASTYTVKGYAPARLIDSDGDKVDELLLAVEQTIDHARSAHFGVFSVSDGKLRHLTPALGSADDSMLTAAAYGRLLTAQPNGQLTGYDLASGDQQWTSALGERVAALCQADAKATDALQVVTDDGRNLLLDVKTGRQSTTSRPCTVPLAVSMGRHAPSDRRDYRAPLATEAWLCGGVRVMGSDNYTVPDACRQHAQIDTDKLDGMVGHALWRVGKDYLVLGVRKPGTYVPTVGLLARGRWVWKSEVPAANPLDAETGGPRLVSLQGERLLIGYDTTKPRSRWITSFDVRDGTRRWSVTLPGPDPRLVALVQNDDVVVAQTDHTALLLAPDSGKTIAMIGGVTE